MPMEISSLYVMILILGWEQQKKIRLKQQEMDEVQGLCKPEVKPGDAELFKLCASTTQKKLYLTKLIITKKVTA